MSPKDKALAQIFQIGLFRWADVVHDYLDDLKLKYPNQSDELSRMHLRSEAAIDSAIENFNRRSSDNRVELIEYVHAQIAEIKSWLEE